MRDHIALNEMARKLGPWPGRESSSEPVSLDIETQMASILVQAHERFNECMRDLKGKHAREAMRWMDKFYKLANLYLYYQQVIKVQRPCEKVEIELFDSSTIEHRPAVGR